MAVGRRNALIDFIRVLKKVQTIRISRTLIRVNTHDLNDTSVVQIVCAVTNQGSSNPNCLNGNGNRPSIKNEWHVP